MAYSIKNLFYIVLIQFWVNCNTNSEGTTDILGNQNDELHNIYIDSLVVNDIDNSLISILIEISNANTDRFDTVPDTIASKLVKLSETNLILLCKFFIPVSDNLLGEFHLVSNNSKNVLLMTYSKNGSLIDYISFKYMVLDSKTWNKYYSDYYYLNSNEIIISTTNHRENVAHPSLAKVLRTDKWEVSENGDFVLQK